MNATLEAMARALFQSWFVDFDPVRRNAEGGESRPENPLFPDSFEATAIGEVPRGWKVERVFECLGNVLESLRKQVAEIGSGNREHKKPTLEELRHFYAERAAELGINLSDPDDKIAEIVRIGLEDLDPTRVSKNCKHIHVAVGSYGMPGEMLGLPTAGSKQVICLKHGHALQSLKLDSAYESFRKLWPWDR